MTWQPIKTAPRNGTHIIVAVPMYGAWFVGEAYYKSEPGTSDNGWWWSGEDPGDYHAEKIESQHPPGPEKWQPLPEPPK